MRVEPGHRSNVQLTETSQSPLRKTKSAEHLACPRIVISKVSEYVLNIREREGDTADCPNSVEMFQPLRNLPLSLDESPAKCGFYLSIPSGGEEGEDVGDDEK